MTGHSSCSVTFFLGVREGRWIIALRTAVLIPVRQADREVAFIIQDKGRRHVAGDKADLHFHADELHGDIIAGAVDGNRGIATNLPINPVHETLIQPFLALYRLCLVCRFLVTLKRSTLDAGVEHQVVLTDVIPEDVVELFQGMDGFHVQPVDKPFLAASPEPLLFLSEHADKNSYATDFFIRIFFEKKQKYSILFRKDADKKTPIMHNGSIKY